MFEIFSFMERYMVVLKSYKRMPKELENALLEKVYPISFCKGDIIQEAGTVSDKVYFVERGLLRLYLLNEHGKEITLRFKKEDEFIICLKTDCSEPEYLGDGIEALEDGTLWCFSGELMEDLKQKFSQFLMHHISIASSDIVAIQKSARYSRRGDSAGNFDRLCKYSPSLLDRVPMKYLAEYTYIPEHILRHLHSTKKKLGLSLVRRRRSR